MIEYHASYYLQQDGLYVAEILDFPGVLTQGRTLNAARRMLRSALLTMARWHIEDGEPLPKPKPRASTKNADVLEPIRLVLHAKSGVAS